MLRVLSCQTKHFELCCRLSTASQIGVGARLLFEYLWPQIGICKVAPPLHSARPDTNIEHTLLPAVQSIVTVTCGSNLQ